MPINNNRVVHNKLIKPVKLHRRGRKLNATTRRISPIRPVPVVKTTKTTSLPKLNRQLRISAKPAGRSTKRTLFPRPVEIAVKGAPGLNEDKVNRLKNIKKGKLLVIVGNGPSAGLAPLDVLTGHEDLDIMSINRPDKRVWPSDYWLFCDNSQYRRHIKLWNSYKGNIINASSVTRTRKNVVRIKSLSGKGFSRNLVRGFYIGRSSVYAAMQVALWMGYDEIFLFGVDMCAIKGKLYSWGSNPDVKDHTRLKRFKIEAQFYTHAVKDLPEHICKRFYFCSKYNKFPFIEKYNRLDEMKAPEIILEKIKKKVGDKND